MRVNAPVLADKGLIKMVIEGAMEGELDDHLGYARHDAAGRYGANSRDGCCGCSTNSPPPAT